MGQPTKLRPGVSSGSGYPPVTFLFTKKIPKNNILVGEDPALLRFFTQHTGRELTKIDKVTDDLLMGHTGLTLRVYAAHCLDLSQDVEAATGIWSAEPLTKGSAGVHALVKQAAAMLDLKLSKEDIETVSSAIAKEGISDVRGALWQTVWELTGEIKAPVKWLDPWGHPSKWLLPETDPSLRLNTLYRTLVGWAFISTDDAPGIKQLNISPSKQAFLKTLQLKREQVYQAIKLLSAWRMVHSDPYICALRIAAIWK